MIEIRSPERSELRAAAATVGTALLFAPRGDEDWAKSEQSWAEADALTAWDGDRCVAHVAGIRVDTVVPGGGRLPTSAVTRVGVLPTHRRRGLATTLMTRLLEEARDRGQVLSSLRASEAVIYRRYGYGVAGDAMSVTVDPAAARPIRGGDGGTMRILAPDEILDTVTPLYDRSMSAPGAITRPRWMWERYFAGALELGGDAEFVAVHTGTRGADDGYVHYRVKWRETPNEPTVGEGEVIELYGVTPAVELALWSYVCHLDLIRKWTAPERPVDDLVRLATADMRSYHVAMRYDEQWLRLLDVDAALSARTYGDAGDSVTIAVSDHLFAVNDGVWRIEPKGAVRDDRDPSSADLAVDVATLAVTYLGGFRWSALAAVGDVDVRDERALFVADALFAAPRAPFCGSFF
jgi:predicted acetyltransferase